MNPLLVLYAAPIIATLAWWSLVNQWQAQF